MDFILYISIVINVILVIFSLFKLFFPKKKKVSELSILDYFEPDNVAGELTKMVDFQKTYNFLGMDINEVSTSKVLEDFQKDNTSNIEIDIPAHIKDKFENYAEAIKILHMNNFDYVWNEWIMDIVDKVQIQADENFVKYVSMESCDLNNLRYVCSKCFQDARQKLKLEFYGNLCSNLEEKCLSYAKLASIICYSLIKHKVFKFDMDKVELFREEHNIERTNTDWLVKNVLINYRIALYSCLVFIYHSLEFNYYETKNFKMLTKLKEENTLLLYRLQSCINGSHEDFDNYLVLNFAKRDRAKKDFDFISFSSILCGLQEFNHIIWENDIHYEALKKINFEEKINYLKN